MMNGYHENTTQEERILNLLQERGAAGAYVYEFMMPRNKGGLGIAQYNARIYGLRKKGHIIKNAKPGHFILEEEPKPKQESLDDIVAALS